MTNTTVNTFAEQGKSKPQHRITKNSNTDDHHQIGRNEYHPNMVRMLYGTLVQKCTRGIWLTVQTAVAMVHISNTACQYDTYQREVQEGSQFRIVHVYSIVRYFYWRILLLLLVVGGGGVFIAGISVVNIAVVVVVDDGSSSSSRGGWTFPTFCTAGTAEDRTTCCATETAAAEPALLLL